MKVFRYEAKNRTDRKYNNCGREKNPMQLKFWASNLDYAKKYQFIKDASGDVVYECELVTAEISADVKLFDMEVNFTTLKVYQDEVATQVASLRNIWAKEIEAAKTAKNRKFYQAKFDGVELDVITSLNRSLNMLDFQTLSDFENQFVLVAELKARGFDGYKTKNEVVIF
jgi:hypothetical protein